MSNFTDNRNIRLVVPERAYLIYKKLVVRMFGFNSLKAANKIIFEKAIREINDNPKLLEEIKKEIQDEIY